MSDKYARLRLDNQLCFPLYACSREIIRTYKPFLDAIDLTYTQYITMMVVWEERQISVKEMGKRLYLDSGTLTPVLKKLEAKGYVTRKRSEIDERSLIVTLTEKGEALQDEALHVPEQMGQCLRLSPEDAKQLCQILRRWLKTYNEDE
jgi:DNA-binding MarR family transcriptional regulator